jgi:hypothetical protein
LHRFGGQALNDLMKRNRLLVQGILCCLAFFPLACSSDSSNKEAAKNTDLLGKTNSYFPMRLSNVDGATLVELGLVKISSRVTNWYALASNKSLSITAGQNYSYLGRVPIRFEIITTNVVAPHEVRPPLTIQSVETELTPERTNILSVGNLMISIFPIPTEQVNAKK